MRLSIRRTAWVDLVIELIERLPIPVWTSYLVLLVAMTAINWLIVGSEFSRFELAYSAGATVFVVALNHAIHRLAGSAFDQFAPSLSLTQDEREVERHRFMYAPAWLGAGALLLGLGTVAQEFAYTQQELAVQLLPALVLVGVVLNFGGNSAFTMYFLGNTVRRLAHVIRLHRRVHTIDLFDLDSMRAFSRFSSGTAIGLILLVLVALRFYLDSAGDVENLMFLVVVTGLALAVFLVPLIGLRNRIMMARDTRVTDLMKDVDLITHRIRAAVHEDRLDKIDKYKLALDAFLMQRDELLKVRTWPWNPATLRGLSSAFLLPVFIWIVTRLLGRFI